MSLKETFMNLGSKFETASPQIKIVVGVVGLIGAGVIACISTAKVKEKTEEERKAMEDIHKVDASRKDEIPEEDQVAKDICECYSDKDKAKDIIRVGASYVGKLLRLYAIPLVMTVLSVGLIFNGTHILNTRNVALSAAYASLSTAYEEYRSRVKERFGEEVEDELHYGAEYKKVKEVTTDENGEKKVETKKAPVLKDDPTKASPYSILFDQRCGEHVNDVEYDNTFLRGIQAQMQDQLDAKSLYLTFADLCRELDYKFDGSDKNYQLMSMRCGWRHGDKIDLRIKRVYITEGGVIKPYCLIDPNVRDIYAEIITENQYEDERRAV